MISFLKTKSLPDEVKSPSSFISNTSNTNSNTNSTNSTNSTSSTGNYFLDKILNISNSSTTNTTNTNTTSSRKSRSSKIKKPFAEFQSSIESRASLSREISKTIKNNFTQLPCQESWELFFNGHWYDKLWGQPSKLGGGQYGSVYKVFLKKYKHHPLAIKRTHDIQLTEARHTLLASLLPECGANPHFLILYAHFHCETLYTAEAKKKLSEQLIPWNQGLMKIKELEIKKKQIQQQIENIKNTTNNFQSYQTDVINTTNTTNTTKKNTLWNLQKEVQTTNNNITLIYKNLYADDEVLKYYTKIKKEKEQAMKKVYYNKPKNYQHDSIFHYDNLLVQKVSTMHDIIQENRKKYHQPFELILMEMADESFSYWLGQDNISFKKIVSASFQVCMALLTLVGFFNIVQNDLLLHNIMYNWVDPSTFYVYKVNQTYFKVPLFGRLVKIIDFGLSTDVKTFYQPTKVHWCVGGQGQTQDDSKKTCSVFVRDMLEYFYHLNTDYVWSGKRKGIGRWIYFCYQKLKYVKEDSINTAGQFILEAFSTETLNKFNLNDIIEQDENPLEFNTKYQSDVFEVTNPQKYEPLMNDIIENKLLQF